METSIYEHIDEMYKEDTPYRWSMVANATNLDLLIKIALEESNEFITAIGECDVAETIDGFVDTHWTMSQLYVKLGILLNKRNEPRMELDVISALDINYISSLKEALRSFRKAVVTYEDFMYLERRVALVMHILNVGIAQSNTEFNQIIHKAIKGVTVSNWSKFMLNGSLSDCTGDYPESKLELVRSNKYSIWRLKEDHGKAFAGKILKPKGYVEFNPNEYKCDDWLNFF